MAVFTMLLLLLMASVVIQIPSVTAVSIRNAEAPSRDTTDTVSERDETKHHPRPSPPPQPPLYSIYCRGVNCPPKRDAAKPHPTYKPWPPICLSEGDPSINCNPKTDSPNSVVDLPIRDSASAAKPRPPHNPVSLVCASEDDPSFNCNVKADPQNNIVDLPSRDSVSAAQDILNIYTTIFVQEFMAYFSTTQQWQDECANLNATQLSKIGLNGTLFHQILCVNNGDPTQISGTTLLSSIVEWSTALWSLQALAAFGGNSQGACQAFNEDSAAQALLNGTMAKSSLCTGRLASEDLEEAVEEGALKIDLAGIFSG